MQLIKGKCKVLHLGRNNPHAPLHAGAQAAGKQLCRKWSVFFGAQYQDQKQQAQSETWEVPSEHQEILFCCGSDQALAQVPRGGCGISLLGDIQKLSGHGPGQSALGDPT